MTTPQDVQRVKSIVSGWDAQTQEAFRNQFNKSDVEMKDRAIQNVISKYGAGPKIDIPQPGMANEVLGAIPGGLMSMAGQPSVVNAVETPAAINRASVMMALGDKTANPMTATPQNTPTLRERYIPKGIEQVLTNPFIKGMLPPVNALDQIANVPDMIVDPAQMAIGALGGKALGSKGLRSAVADIPNTKLGITELQNILKLKNVDESVLAKMKSKVAQPAALSEELAYQVKEARKVAGATQGGHIDVNASDPIDLNRIQRVVDELSPKVQKTIFEDTKLSRVGDMVEATLKNAEIIRGHIGDHIKTLDYQSQAPVQQAYNEVGKIMTENQPALREAMQVYGETAAAEERLLGRLKTEDGLTKSNPIKKMFGKNVDKADLDAITILSKQNPGILDTLAKIKKMTNSLERTAAIKKLIPILSWTGLSAAAVTAATTAIVKAVKGNS